MFKFDFKKRLKIIVVIILLIFLHWIKVLSPVEKLIGKITRPLFQKIYNTTAAWRENSQDVNWEEKAKGLETQVNDLTVANANLKNLENENQKLREYLDFFSTTKTNHLLANVIAQENFLDANKYGQNVIIDKGTKNNLEPGLVVVNGQGIVVGKILEVQDTSAKICLLTNESCKLAVTVLNQNRTIGVTEGNLGLTVKLNFVGQTEKINLGDIITTSGLEKNIPTGLVVGRISQINNNQNDVWQNINVEPLVNFDNLGIVSIVMP
jgi:rod shape-determining protein MreC